MKNKYKFFIELSKDIEDVVNSWIEERNVSVLEMDHTCLDDSDGDVHVCVSILYISDN